MSRAAATPTKRSVPASKLSSMPGSESLVKRSRIGITAVGYFAHGGCLRLNGSFAYVMAWYNVVARLLATTIESSARRREPTANIGEDDMARKRDKRSDDSKRQADKALNRRDFFRGGAAAGVGATVLSTSAMAQENGAQGIRWNYEADVVILGAGCVGLHAAVRARDLGASVLVIEQNFDVGGKLVHSGGWTSLGGGDAIQERDKAAADPLGMGLTAPLFKPEDP